MFTAGILEEMFSGAGFEYLYFNNPLILKSDNRHINDIYIEKALKLLDN